MKLILLLIIVSYSIKRSYLDFGFTLDDANMTNMLTKPDYYEVNVLQPLDFIVDKQTMNHASYLNSLVEIRTIFHDAGLQSIFNNVTSSKFTCERVGFSATCKRDWSPLYFGELN